MVIKRLFSLLIAGAAAVFGLYCVFVSVSLLDIPSSVAGLSDWADRSVVRQLSKSERLNQAAPALLLAFGAKEQDGIFITEEYLLENIAAPSEQALALNLAGVEAFINGHNTRTAMVLIPTACAIKQQELPASASLLNQKSLIADCYSRFSGLVSTVDAYSQLFSAQNQYIYYRTETLPTGLGGYYIYTAITSRLGITPRPLDQFEMENLPQDYYGSLYQRSSFKSVPPDMLTLYRFSRYSRQYKLSVTENGEQKSYYTLFPTHLSALNDPKSVIFGGFGERMDISVASPYEDSILIFADESALSYLPFLVVHYGNITMIDLSAYPSEEIAGINVSDYDQVLFSYSLDNFIHQNMCEAAALVP